MERRAHFRGRPRGGRRVELHYRPAGAPESSSRPAVTHDIGVGGAFIETEAPAPVGSALEVTIEVPGPSSPIQLRAEVRWIAEAGSLPPGRAAGMGVRFAALEVDALLALSDFFAGLAGGANGGQAHKP